MLNRYNLFEKEKKKNIAFHISKLNFSFLRRNSVLITFWSLDKCLEIYEKYVVS